MPWAELWYNTTFHASSKTTPYQVVYDRPPPPLISYGERKATNNSADQLLKERDMVINALKNLHRREMNFQVGEEVYQKLRHTGNDP